jgi:hypothetical protein
VTYLSPAAWVWRLRSEHSIGPLAKTGGTVTAQSNRVDAHRIVDGKELNAAAVNEHQARAAAGITLAFGTVAFVYANFDKLFWPIRTVSAFFFVDFLFRVTAGLERSPSGFVARWMTRRQAPQWVSAKPKRFAWTLGLSMALAMTVITNSGIHGPLPRTICLICLTLMWMEAVLGLCLGCEIYAVMVRRRWRAPDKAFEVCANGACDLNGVEPDLGAPSTNWTTKHGTAEQTDSCGAADPGTRR